MASPVMSMGLNTKQKTKPDLKINTSNVERVAPSGLTPLIEKMDKMETYDQLQKRLKNEAMAEQQRKRAEYVQKLQDEITANNKEIEKRRTRSSKGRVFNLYNQQLGDMHSRIAAQGKYDYYDLAYSRAITHQNVFTHAIRYGH